MIKTYSLVLELTSVQSDLLSRENSMLCSAAFSIHSSVYFFPPGFDMRSLPNTSKHDYSSICRRSELLLTPTFSQGCTYFHLCAAFYSYNLCQWWILLSLVNKNNNVTKIQICSGITRNRVRNVELDAQKLQKLLNVHLSTDCPSTNADKLTSVTSVIT